MRFFSRGRPEGQLSNASEFVADVARSIGFLSRLPVPDRFFKGEHASVSGAVRAFPLAGLFIGVPPALFLLLFAARDPLLASLVALALLTFLTGALHEDGLADAADGLGGGRDREHSLSIMKDSRTGSYGVVALVLSLAARAAALAGLASYQPAAAAFGLLAAAALSRAILVAHWRALPPARENGVATGAGTPSGAGCNVALFSGVAMAVVLLAPIVGLPLVLLSVIAAGVSGLAFTRLVRIKLAGHTGDTIGATQQISEIVMLTTLALAV